MGLTKLDTQMNESRVYFWSVIEILSFVGVVFWQI